MNSPDHPDHESPPAANPRPGHNPGYSEDRPRDKGDVPRHQPDARGADFGRLPNPESGHVEREGREAPEQDPAD